MILKTADAIKVFGNANRMAKALGINRSAVSQWGENLPPRRVIEIAQMIEQGKVSGGDTPVKQEVG